MTDCIVSSHVSWLDLSLEQKLFLSMHSEQVKLFSGDGFSVSLPSELLLASSGLARRTFIAGEEGQAVFLPSVRGSTLLLLVEILRSGVTSNPERMESMRDRLWDIREVMKLLDIPGSVDMMGIKNNASEIRTLKETKQFRNVQSSAPIGKMMQIGRDLLKSFTPVVEITRMRVIDDLELDRDSVEDEEDVTNKNLVNKSRRTGQPRECHVCKKMYPHNSWTKHIRRAHSEYLLPCGHCGKKFIWGKFLEEHVFRAHKEDGIGCGFCPSRYRNKELLNSHVKRSHRSELVSCGFCSLRFVNKDALKIHMENTHQGPWKCSECPSSFINETKLRSHVKGVHSGVRLVCPECSSTFSFASSLKRHVMKSHKNRSDVVVESNAQFENKDMRDGDMQERVESEELVEQVDNIKTEILDESNSG